jgi:hypothetical protein
MQDTDKKSYFKRKFLEIQAKRASGGKKWQNSKKQKKF